MGTICNSIPESLFSIPAYLTAGSLAVYNTGRASFGLITFRHPASDFYTWLEKSNPELSPEIFLSPNRKPGFPGHPGKVASMQGHLYA